MQARLFGYVGVLLSAAACIVINAGSIARAEEPWPSKSIRVVVPLTPGSAVDVVPRIVLEEVSKDIGQTFVIENRPGATGALAARAVAGAEPDGYTLLAHSSALAIARYTIPNAGYDPIKDFVPIAGLALVPNVLVVAPDKNINTLRDLATAARG